MEAICSEVECGGYLESGGMWRLSGLRWYVETLSSEVVCGGYEVSGSSQICSKQQHCGAHSPYHSYQISPNITLKAKLRSN